jgi:SAM-dependent methyltransferase
MGAYNKTGDNVRAAVMNRVFYDLAADVYEEADGRRGDLSEQVKENIRRRHPQQSPRLLIDVGAGTGYATKYAATKYACVYAMDISAQMLSRIQDKRIHLFQCDATDVWPFHYTVKAQKIMAIATLHHIPDFRPLLDQADLHMDRGGYFYSDLDIDESFCRLWKWPLRIYRKIRQAGKRYMALQPAVSEELFDAVEVHSEGIPTEKIQKYLTGKGYNGEIVYHWGDGRPFPKGLAPYVSIWATKKEER